jgi:hypothetical protein
MPANTPLKNSALRASKAPNIPIAPVEYAQQYQDQMNNALRLYFTEVDNISQAVVIPSSGITANRPVNTGSPKLPTGLFYFDTTLGLPIWWNGTNWVNASGTVV